MTRILLTLGCLSLALILLILPRILPAGSAEQENRAEEEVSFYRDVRPIFQANCQGCHQPARASGDYVMTSFDRLLHGGESETSAVVADIPDESYLIELITPTDGKAQMPKKGDPLSESQIALIRRWIEAGAVNDTPPETDLVYDAEHPPKYTRPPVITSLDYSPDGQHLAVSGFHEVLLHRPDGSGIVARLVGLSERIESVKFSPDGKQLAVTGGRAGRMGELQVWDVESENLTLSMPITSDTVYGASWSPDGKYIALGCADSTLRVVATDSGEQVVYMAAHYDWVRDTVFSADGKSVFTVSRDQTVKMTDVATERFIGNVTSHTPGILSGGMNAIARHPQRDELLAGGADGAPKLFKMEVTAAPAGGGNPNQIREYGQLIGRVFDVGFNVDGSRAFAGSSLNGAGQARAFDTDSGDELWKLDVPGSGVFAIACSPDGNTVAVGGFDGMIRLIAAASGDVQHEFLPVELAGDAVSPEQAVVVGVADQKQVSTLPNKSLPETAQIELLVAQPDSIQISRPDDYAQIVLTARLAGGASVDVTRMAQWRIEGEIGHVSDGGRVTPESDGAGKLVAELGGKSVEVPLNVTGFSADYVPDFIRDVAPVISKAGCNAGTCHGSKDGKNGFKLSLRGYDPVLDVRGFADDLAARRVNLARPENSLMLLKSTSSVPHQGGQALQLDSAYYRIIRDWIASGAALVAESPKVSGIRVSPANPVVERVGDLQQMRVVATYQDGTSRDVTHEAFLEIGNTDVAETVAGYEGLVRVLRRGEAPVLVRYEGSYASTTITVMGDRSGFVWQQPPANNRIDEFVYEKLQRTKTLPAPLCNDYEFVRRVYLDLTGLPPTVEEIHQFIGDARDSRWKRDERVDRLVGSPEFVEHWTNKWADLLQVNSKFLGSDGAAAFRDWIRNHVEQNTPYDDFARQVITASGSNRENPAASYFKILRSPEEMMENTTHLFLATRFNCNKCHDHPFERWTQDQYYEMAAFFARVGLEKDPESGDRTVDPRTLGGAKPLYEVVFDKDDGDVTHARTGAMTSPAFPFECDFSNPEGASRRQQLAAWLTSPDNPYFATSYVNRIWGYLLGAGLIEPLDDIRAGNPPSNPELLDWLTDTFVQSGFDVRLVMRTICKSRTYQQSIVTGEWNADDKINFSHALLRRLPAEVLYDAIHRVTGTQSQFPGVPAGTRAAALPDVGIKLPDGFLGNLGRPPRESACECERTNDLQMAAVMSMVSGPTVNDAISDANNHIARLVASQADDWKLVEELFLQILNRPATSTETGETLKLMDQVGNDHEHTVSIAQEYEQQLPAIMERRERRRQENLTKQEARLVDYQKELAPRLAQPELARQQKLAETEFALQTYRESLSEKISAWETRLQQPQSWVTIEPRTMEASSGSTLTLQDDRSVFASEKLETGVYHVISEVAHPGITAVKLEALIDERLPKNGPGRADDDGSFVLSEFELAWAAVGDDPNQEPEWNKVALSAARADFNQAGYHVSTSIDGTAPDRDNGWAIAPKVGENHVAVFELQEDLSSADRYLLKFSLHQNYHSGKHALGRFRLSVGSISRPVEVTPFKEIADIIAIDSAQRSQEQVTQLEEYYRDKDDLYQKLQEDLADASKPLPVDPELSKLNERLAKLRRPLPADPKLLRLRHDVELSRQQLENRRLTVAQDLTWALINSPAFLFNH